MLCITGSCGRNADTMGMVLGKGRCIKHYENVYRIMQNAAMSDTPI